MTVVSVEPPSPSVLHVEVAVKPTSSARFDIIRACVEESLKLRMIMPHSSVHFADIEFLKENVECVRTCEIVGDRHCGGSYSFIIHVFQLHDSIEERVTDHDTDDDNKETASSTALSLPSNALEGLWESLIFDENITTKLLDYVSTAMEFAERGIDPNMISFSKVVLLHGPPGTGKTSLCKALSQKLSIRLSGKFSFFLLVEINSHALFSKFFSESGKLVTKMFQNIKDMCDDPETFVTVLIDEVESLTAARKAAVSGMEPSDAIRVVNALLTQIDSLKRRRNVLILATSNITEAIDLAFVDRADLKQYIGLPSKKVVYALFSSVVGELTRCGMISDNSSLIDWRGIELFAQEGKAMTVSDRLYQISGKCVGFSGRTLRKLPFLAHASYIKSFSSIKLSQFLDALECAIADEHKGRAQLNSL